MKKYVYYSLISAAMVPTVSIASNLLDDHSADPMARVAAKEQKGGYNQFASPYSKTEAKEMDASLFKSQNLSFKARLAAAEEAERLKEEGEKKLAVQKQQAEKDLAELEQQLKASRAEARKLKAASESVVKLEADLADVKALLTKTEIEKAGFENQLALNKEDLRRSQDEVEQARKALEQATAGALANDDAKQREITVLREELANKEATVKRREGLIAFSKSKLEEATKAFSSSEEQVHRLSSELLKEQTIKKELEVRVQSLTEQNELMRRHILDKDPSAVVPAATSNADDFNSDDEDTKIGSGGATDKK